MSADTYYRICKHPKGGYAAVMGFMSNKLDGIEAAPRDDSPQYATVAEAVAVADRETILEYGIEYDADCLPLPPGQPNASVLQLAFWEAMKRCDDSGLPYLGSADNGDKGVIDGSLPDDLWEHMAVAIAELRAATGLGGA